MHCILREKLLQVSVIRRSGYVYPEKLKRPPPPSDHKISGCKMSAHGIPGYEMSPRCQSIRINSIRIPPRGHARQAILLSLDDNISYPDMVSGWKTLTKVSKPSYSPRSIALQGCVRTPCQGILLAWIPKNSPQSHIALVIKKLSKHQN